MKAGATAHIPEDLFPASKAYASPSLHLLLSLTITTRSGTAYVAPQVLTNVNHSTPFPLPSLLLPPLLTSHPTPAMSVMTEETFGPVVGIQKVSGDDEALALMNDSQYGLTASVWTSDDGAFARFADELAAGTVFLNRCDFLDPALAWTGVKDSGRGVSLSSFGPSFFVCFVIVWLLMIRFCFVRRIRPAHAREERAHEVRRGLADVLTRKEDQNECSNKNETMYRSFGSLVVEGRKT